MTRGRCGSLLHFRMTFASTTPRRFNRRTRTHKMQKLGADASAAAGPKGRNAEASTDVTLRAEVLTYSRARGLFAGISLAGSTVRPDNNANEKVYDKKVEAQDIVFKGTVRVPTAAQPLVAYLNKK